MHSSKTTTTAHNNLLARSPSLFCNPNARHPIFIPLLFCLSSAAAAVATSTDFAPSKNRCYSCASDNMKENFLARSRGPPGRVHEPRLFDSMCDSDTWVIREKSAVDCQGPCFKWQQTLNNSGVLSYATIRGCYERMFDPTVAKPFVAAADPSSPSSSSSSASSSSSSSSSYTTECKHVQRALVCLDEYSSVEEATCWCFGDFCNTATRGRGKVAMMAVMMVMMMMVQVATTFCPICTPPSSLLLLKIF